LPGSNIDAPYRNCVHPNSIRAVKQQADCSTRRRYRKRIVGGLLFAAVVIFLGLVIGGIFR
jgi:hypothetical protein